MFYSSLKKNGLAKYLAHTQKGFVERMKTVKFIFGVPSSPYLFPFFSFVVSYPASPHLTIFMSSSILPPWLADASYFQLPSGFGNKFTYVINYKPLESGKSVDPPLKSVESFSN